LIGKFCKSNLIMRKHQNALVCGWRLIDNFRNISLCMDVVFWEWVNLGLWKIVDCRAIFDSHCWWWITIYDHETCLFLPPVFYHLMCHLWESSDFGWTIFARPLSTMGHSLVFWACWPIIIRKALRKKLAGLYQTLQLETESRYR
jgi:hypothetical protein